MMKKRVSQTSLVRMMAALLLALLCTTGAAAQQAAQPAMQPITHYTDYTIRPGREADFMDLVNKVGAPVRDKLMKDGVIFAWGMEVPLVRGVYGSTTHTIWYAVADWASVEKVQAGMTAQLQRIGAEEAKAAEEARKKNQKPAMSTMERANDIYDASKTRDLFTRDIVFVTGTAPTSAGWLPFTRYGFTQVRPGKGADYRAAWDKYNKPVYDSLVKDGTIAAYGLAVEEVKTTNEFTHFTWYAMTSLGSSDKVRAAFMADRAKRSAEEREAIGTTFSNAIDSTASRSLVTRSIIFREASMK